MSAILLQLVLGLGIKFKPQKKGEVRFYYGATADIDGTKFKIGNST